MSLSMKKANALLEEISEKFGVDLDELYAVAGGRVKRPDGFASPKAREFFERMGLDRTKIKGSGKGGKITIDDIRVASGEPSKKKINLFASTSAKKLAEENSLTEDDFLPSERTGRRLKSNNKKTITIYDCRKKLGLLKTKKSKKTKKTKKQEESSDSDSSDSE